jgi:hypothetical protein
MNAGREREANREGLRPPNGAAERVKCGPTRAGFESTAYSMLKDGSLSSGHGFSRAVSDPESRRLKPLRCAHCSPTDLLSPCFSALESPVLIDTLAIRK